MKIVQVGDGGVSQSVRLGIPGRFLESRGHTIDHIETSILPSSLPEGDIYIISRLPCVDIIAEKQDQGKKVIFDLDDDFFSIPDWNPAYRSVGPGNLLFLDKLVRTLEKASIVTVASQQLFEVVKQYRDGPIVLIPNAWTGSPGLDFHNENEEYVTMGWAGTTTHRVDFDLIKIAVKKLIHSHKNLRILIAGDSNLYKLLSDLPEKQKLFIPPVRFDFYFYMLGYMDIVLAPLVEIPFNLSKSSLRLVDAGAKGLPWVASPVGEYQRYGEVGGYFANDQESWIWSVEHLLLPSIYRFKAEESRKQAENFHISKLGILWEELL